jgi:hypothetical protein
MDLEPLHLGVDPHPPQVDPVQEITAPRVVQVVAVQAAEMGSPELTTNGQIVTLDKRFEITPQL